MELLIVLGNGCADVCGGFPDLSDKMGGSFFPSLVCLVPFSGHLCPLYLIIFVSLFFLGSKEIELIGVHFVDPLETVNEAAKQKGAKRCQQKCRISCLDRGGWDLVDEHAIIFFKIQNPSPWQASGIF